MGLKMKDYWRYLLFVCFFVLVSGSIVFAQTVNNTNFSPEVNLENLVSVAKQNNPAIQADEFIYF